MLIAHQCSKERNVGIFLSSVCALPDLSYYSDEILYFNLLLNSTYNIIGKCEDNTLKRKKTHDACQHIIPVTDICLFLSSLISVRIWKRSSDDSINWFLISEKGLLHFLTREGGWEIHEITAFDWRYSVLSSMADFNYYFGHVILLNQFLLSETFRLKAIVFCICTWPGTKEVNCSWGATSKLYFYSVMGQHFSPKINV